MTTCEIIAESLAMKLFFMLGTLVSRTGRIFGRVCFLTKLRIVRTKVSTFVCVPSFCFYIEVRGFFTTNVHPRTSILTLIIQGCYGVTLRKTGSGVQDFPHLS